jgi:hypothetical protein
MLPRLAQVLPSAVARCASSSVNSGRCRLAAWPTKRYLPCHISNITMGESASGTRSLPLRGHPHAADGALLMQCVDASAGIDGEPRGAVIHSKVVVTEG